MRIISGTAKGAKLFTLEGRQTRPTLDRVKESVFNIIQGKLTNANMLDLFAGSGAIGLEALSRGAKRVIFCDKSKEAVQVIRRNIEKTRLGEKAIVCQIDYQKCLDKFEKELFDIIYLDPPYDSKNTIQAIIKIIENKMLNKDGIIIIETDQEKEILKELETVNITVQDVRKYGRVYIMILTV